MIKRELENKIKELACYFPVVSVTGPRQSGKSTLVQMAFPDYDYLNLENPSIYNRALNDPVGFIFNLTNKTIIDEAQLVPEIFSVTQLYVDKNDIPGSIILTGSQNFLLSKKINQSLAGRVGIAKLLPMTWTEIAKSKYATNTESIILQGGYPRLYTKNFSTKMYYDNYIDTYIKRDVEGYLSVRNSIDFEKLIILLSQNCGQLVNYNRLANDIKVDIKTIKNWISVLVSSYIIYLLPAYSTNTRKQIIKTPKIYFCDTGLLCNLLNIKSTAQLINHDKFGCIFENFVIMEQIKHYLNNLDRLNINYYRDKSRMEIDMVDCTNHDSIVTTEIKSGMTFKPSFNKVLKQSDYLLNSKKISKSIIYRGEHTFNYEGTNVMHIDDWLKSLNVPNCTRLN